MYYFIYFININAQSKISIRHLESFSMVLLSKKLVLFAENERPAKKPKSTKFHRDTNSKTLNVIDRGAPDIVSGRIVG